VGKPGIPVIDPNYIEMDVPPKRFTVYISPPTEEITSFNWYLNGVISASHTHHAIFARKKPYCDGIYLVQVEFINSCGTSPKGIATVYEPSCDEYIMVYPNPVSGEGILSISLGPHNLIEEGDAREGDLTLLNSEGHIVHRQKISAGKSFVNLQRLNQGIYFLKVEFDDRQFEKRLLID
jgi:hypothetical protein